jgi:hypothetical protein
MAVSAETLNTFRALLNLPEATEDEIVGHLALIRRAGYQLVDTYFFVAEVEKAVAEIANRIYAQAGLAAYRYQLETAAPDEASIQAWLEHQETTSV